MGAMPVMMCAPIRTKLVHFTGEAAKDRIIADMHMASQLRVVREDRVVADLTVVRQVHVGHDPVVVADARHSRPSCAVPRLKVQNSRMVL